jgi:hypothetical protein
VTEVVEPTVPEDTDSEDEREDRRRGPQLSFASESSLGVNDPGYSMMERSESHTREDDETARKFRSVFSLSEKEELIDRELNKCISGSFRLTRQTFRDICTESYPSRAGSSSPPTTSASDLHSFCTRRK